MKKKNNQLVDLKAKINKTKNILERGKLPDEKELVKLLDEIDSLLIGAELKSETLFRTTLYSIGDAVITTDKTGNIQQMNPVAEKLSGWKETEAKNKPFEVVFNIISEVTRKKVKNLVKKVLDDGHIEVLANHTLLISKKGKEIPIADSSAPIKNDKGEVVGVVLVFRDQVKERENQNALEDRERKFSTLVSNLPGFIYRCANDRNWTMQFISDGCKEITGYSPKDFINNKKLAFNDIILPDYQEAIWERWQMLLKDKSYFEDEYPIKNKSGKLRWIWERGRGVFSEQGELLFLEGFITDITAHKNAEELTKESEARYKSLFDSSPDAIFLADPKTRKIIDANHVALKLIGLPLSKVIGMHQSQLHPKRFKNYSSKTFNKHSHNIDTNIPVENFLITANGKEIPIEILASTITVNGKEVIQGVFRNISERKKMENNLQESENKFRALFEHSNDAMMLLDERVFIDCNQAAIKLMGCKSKEQILSHYPAQISPEFQPDGIRSITKAKRIIKDAFKNGTARFEWIHKKISGEEFPVEVTLTSISLGGKPILCKVLRDISERKKIESELQNNKDRMQLLVEGTPQLFFYVQNLEGLVEYISPSIENITGYTVEQWLNQNHWFVTDSTINQIAKDRTHAHLRGEVKTDPVYLEIFHANGSKVMLEIYERPIISKGKVVGLRGVAHNITERVRFEQNLRDSETSYRGLFNSVSEAIYILDVNGIFLDVNQGAVKMYGYDRDELIGKTPEFVSTPDKNDLPSVVKALVKAYNGENQQFEFWGKRKNGEAFLKDVRLYPGIYFNQKVTIAVANDITEKKRSELLLQESEEKYRTLAENINDALYSLTKKGTLTYISGAVKHILGYEPVEVIGTLFTKYVYKEDLNKLPKQYQKILSGTTESIEYRLLEKSGNVHWIRSSGRAVYENNKLVGFQGVMIDINNEKIIEEKLKESEERYRAISNLTSDYVFATKADENGNHNVIWVAGSFEKITGFSIEEYKKIGGWRAIVHPDELELDELDLEKLRKNQKVIREVKTFHKNGSLVWVRSHAHPIWDNKTNKLVGVYGAVEDITERRLAEETLRESEQRYHSFINSHIDLMFVKDENLRYIVANEATLKFFNKTREELLYKTDFELIDEESAKKFQISDLKAFETNSVVISEEITTNKIFESTKFPLTLKNNKIGLGGIIRDITERKRTEIIQKIQYNIADAAVTYKTLTELFENIRIELSSIINVNNFFIAFYDEKTGMLKSDVDKDEMEEISEWPAKNSMTGYVIEKQKSILLKKAEINRMIANGEAGMVGVIPEVWLGVPFKIGGKVFGVLVVQSYDNPNAYDQTSVEILEIIAHELSIYIRHKKAEEETLKLSTAIVQSPIIIVITDPHGNIEYVNPKFSEVTGYLIDEVKGNNLKILKSGYHSKEFYSNLWATILSGQLWQGEFRNKKKNGELYWENALISPLKDSEGNIKHFVAVKEDVTSKKKMIQELIEAKEKAEEMNRIKSSFFANMSHELRTPMVGILGFSEVLMGELKENPDYLHMISSINKSGQRLLETLNLILSLSKLEASKIETNLKPQNIVPLLRESFNFFQSAAVNKGLSYEFVAEKDEFLCEIDQLLFISVFNNLLNNAIKFTDAGNITLNVTADSGNAIIAVTDTGVGISEEKQNLIWDEFRQASEGFNRSFEGTGLGLTIAKKYSNLMKGTISIKSTLGKGTTFLVSFPLTQGSSDSAEQDVSDSNLVLASSLQSEPVAKILYIEDDEIAVKYVTTITKGSYIIDSAKDSDEALLLAKQNKYDAILMDINLRRGMDGIELTGLLRKMENYKSIPIIAVTAFAMGREKEEFLSRGMTHYLSKPFVKHQLLNLLKGALAKE